MINLEFKWTCMCSGFVCYFGYKYSYALISSFRCNKNESSYIFLAKVSREQGNILMH